MDRDALREYLQASGVSCIRYSIPPERYAFQIYKNLGFVVESRDGNEVRFIWRKNSNDWYFFFAWGYAVGAVIYVVLLAVTWLIGFLMRRLNGKVRAAGADQGQQ